MKKANLLTLVLLVVVNFVLAQQVVQKKSIHQEEAEYYKKQNKSGDDYQKDYQNPLAQTRTNNTNNSCTLTKKVYGWHPYWENGSEVNYQWNKLSHLVFAHYEIDPATGNNSNTAFNWSTANAVTQALANNVKAHFSITLFSNHATFLTNATARQTLINNVKSLLLARNAHGVNLDIEGMPNTSKADLTSFVIQFCNAIHAANPNYEVTFAATSFDYTNSYDIPSMLNYIDLFIIMGYDYYYGTSANAGPTSPTYSLTTAYNYNISKSMTYYLKQGVAPSKLLCALPYYGREWNVSGTAPGATTTGGSASVRFKNLKANANGYFNNRLWEPNCLSPYYNYNGKQCFIDDAYSFEKKLNVVEQMGLGGIGIWALGYDDGYTDMWDKIEKKLTTCATVNCSDTIYDGGGPTRDYYANESYTYTLAPTGASALTINFASFALENGHDSLFLYDGPNTSSPLIGKYSGSVGPGSKTTTSGAITLKFKADNALNGAGFFATYTCLTDVVKPTSTVTTTGNWQTQNFNASFTDSDAGLGVDKKFYSISDYSGAAWSSNRTNGFLWDDFSGGLIVNNWQKISGTWSISANQLVQTDDAQSNTNIYTNLNQSNTQAYLYHWKMSMAGSGTNRRAGIHIACNNPDSANRGDSYLVWFRLDNNKVQIYKTQNNNLGSIQQEAPFTFSANTLYDFKVLYDKAGLIKIFINDNLIATWNDVTPIAPANYVSFRTGNASVIIDDFKVYKNRTNTMLVTIGNSTSDIRYQNTSPTAAAAQITSIVTDLANNVSSPVTKNVNVDWSSPIAPLEVRDGITSTDMDSTTNATLLAANWNLGVDTNSLVVTNYYAVGTQPKATDILTWTNNTNKTTFNTNAVTLQHGKTYYTSIVLQNGAGLYSDTIVSDGFKLSDNNSLLVINDKNIRIQPNPVKDILTITTDYKINYIELINLLGEHVSSYLVPNATNVYTLDLTDLSTGVYQLLIYHQTGVASYKVLKQ